MNSNEKYLSQLAAHLQQRGLPDQRINDILAETENHLDESGEEPQDTFGPVEQYSEDIAVRNEDKAENKTGSESGNDKPRYHQRTFRATAFDEMRILEQAGREGWELVDVGALALFCRRPAEREKAVQWEYNRRLGRHHSIILGEMKDGKWEPCGNWMPFHYFKRRI